MAVFLSDHSTLCSRKEGFHDGDDAWSRQVRNAEVHGIKDQITQEVTNLGKAESWRSERLWGHQALRAPWCA